MTGAGWGGGRNPYKACGASPAWSLGSSGSKTCPQPCQSPGSAPREGVRGCSTPKRGWDRQTAESTSSLCPAGSYLKGNGLIGLSSHEQVLPAAVRGLDPLLVGRHEAVARHDALCNLRVVNLGSTHSSVGTSTSTGVSGPSLTGPTSPGTAGSAGPSLCPSAWSLQQRGWGCHVLWVYTGAPSLNTRPGFSALRPHG